MLAALRRRATYANVVATIALILAVGGGSAYALKGRNTVFSDDIAPDQVRGADAREASFRTPRILETDNSQGSTKGGEAVFAIAECPQGYSVTGGGFAKNHPSIIITRSIPYTGQINYDSWYVEGVASEPTQTVTAYAICERGTTLPQPQ